jgi:hypothetical protein
MLSAMTAPVDELMQSAVKARQRARSALDAAVQEARAADWSWDRIASALGGSPTAATLQRAFAGEVAGEAAAGESAGPRAGGCGGACASCSSS